MNKKNKACRQIWLAAAIASAPLTAAFGQTFEGFSAFAFNTVTPSINQTYHTFENDAAIQLGRATNSSQNWRYWRYPVESGGATTRYGSLYEMNSVDFQGIQPNQPFAVADLWYWNGEIYDPGGSRLFTLPVNMTLEFTNLIGVPPTDFSFNFQLQYTQQNQGSNNPDFWTFQNTTAPETFTYGGTRYQLELLYFSRNGGVTQEDSFSLSEWQETESTLYAQIVAQSGPLLATNPATGSTVDFTTVRVGTTGTVTVEAFNDGDPGTTLNGIFPGTRNPPPPGIPSEFGPYTEQSFTHVWGQTPVSRDYTYTPTERNGASGPDVEPIVVTGTDLAGASAGTSLLYLSGTGVGPVYGSAPFNPGSTIVVGGGSGRAMVNTTRQTDLEITNVTTDGDLDEKTDMTLRSATVLGGGSTFNLSNFTPGTVLETNADTTPQISATPTQRGIRSALLTVDTDVSVAFGEDGEDYMYNLVVIGVEKRPIEASPVDFGRLVIGAAPLRTTTIRGQVTSDNYYTRPTLAADGGSESFVDGIVTVQPGAGPQVFGTHQGAPVDVRNVTGVFNTTGAYSGSVPLVVTPEGLEAEGTYTLSVPWTANVVRKRTLETDPIDFGRVYVGTSLTGEATVTTPDGTSLTHTEVTLADKGGPDGQGFEVTGGKGGVFNTQFSTATRDLEGSAPSKAGTFTGGVPLTVTGEGIDGEGTYPDLLINYTGNAVEQRVVTAAPVNYGRVMVGVAQSDQSTLATSRPHEEVTDITVALTGGPDSQSFAVTGGTGTEFNTAASTGTRVLQGTFTSSGAKSGSVGLEVTGEGLDGEEAYDDVQVVYSATAVQKRQLLATTVDFGTVNLGETLSGFTTEISGAITADNFYTNPILSLVGGTDGQVIVAPDTEDQTFDLNDGTIISTRDVSAVFTSAGNLSGTVELTVVPEGLVGEGTYTLLVPYTAEVISDSNRQLFASPVEFGRIMISTPETGVSDITTSDTGGPAELALTGGPNADGAEVTGGTGTVFDDKADTGTRDLAVNFSSAGNKFGAVDLNVTGTTFSTLGVQYTAEVVRNREIESTPVNFGRSMVGVEQSGVTDIAGAVTGDNFYTIPIVDKQGGTDGLATVAADTVDRAVTNNTGDVVSTRGVTATFASRGDQSGDVALSVTPEGLNGEGTYTLGVSYSGTGVEKRPLVSTDVNFGRVMAGVAQTGSTDLAGDVTSDNFYTYPTITKAGGTDGVATVGDGTADQTVLTNDGSVLSTRTVTATFATTGNVTGSVPLVVTPEGLDGEGDYELKVNYSATPVQKRTPQATQVDMGRVVVGSTVTGFATDISAVATPDNFYTEPTLAATGGNDSEVTVASGSSAVFNDNTGATIESRDVSATFLTAGPKSGSINLNVTPEGLDGEGLYDLQVAYTANPVNKRVVTATQVDFGRQMVGVSLSGVSDLSTTGSDDTTTRVTVSLTGGPDAEGMEVLSGTGTSFNSDASTGTRSLEGSFSTRGPKAGSVDLAVGGEGLPGEGAYGPVQVNYSGTALEDRQINATPANFGKWFVDVTPTDATSTLTSPGVDNEYTRVTVKQGTYSDGSVSAGIATDHLFNGGTGTTAKVSTSAFATSGVKSGTIELTPGNGGVEGEGLTGESVNDVSMAYSAEIYVRSNASFDNNSDLDSLTINFPTLEQGTGVQNQPFSIYNLVGGTLTAALDLDARDSSGDDTAAYTNLPSSFVNLAAGSNFDYVASVDTTTTGTFTSTYTLDLSDQKDINGPVVPQQITLTINATVEPGDPDPRTVLEIRNPGFEDLTFDSADTIRRPLPIGFSTLGFQGTQIAENGVPRFVPAWFSDGNELDGEAGVLRPDGTNYTSAQVGGENVAYMSEAFYQDILTTEGDRGSFETLENDEIYMLSFRVGHRSGTAFDEPDVDILIGGFGGNVIAPVDTETPVPLEGEFAEWKFYYNANGHPQFGEDLVLRVAPGSGGFADVDDFFIGIVPMQVEEPEWGLATGGVWGDANSWSDQVIPDTNESVVNLHGNLTANGAVDLESTNRTVRKLSFDNTVASYDVTSTGGGQILLEASSGLAEITYESTNTQSHTISAGVVFNSDAEINTRGETLNMSGAINVPTGRNIAKLGAGTLNFTGPHTIGANTTLNLNAGTTTFAPAAGTTGSYSTINVLASATLSTSGTSVTSGATTIANAGTVNVTGSLTTGGITGSGDLSASGSALLTAEHVRQDEVTLADSANVTVAANGSDTGTSRISRLTVTGSASLDLMDNDLVIENMSESEVVSLLAGGYDGGTWTGSGINSGAAASDPLTTLGYANNSLLGLNEFSGQVGLDGTEMLVKYTWYGDTNLDGVVDFDDLTRFIAGYNNGGDDWSNGDFNYDSSVNYLDLVQFIAGYNASGGVLTPSYSGDLQVAMNAQDVSSALAALSAGSVVPEPAALGVLGLGMLALRRRRR